MGTWSTPNTMTKARQLAKLLARPLPANDATKNALYNLVGDDDLFDSIAQSKREGLRDVRWSVADKLKEWDEWYHARPDDWRDSISPQVWAVLRRAYRKVLAPRGTLR